VQTNFVNLNTKQLLRTREANGCC